MFASLLSLRDGEIAGCSPTAEKYYQKVLAGACVGKYLFCVGIFLEGGKRIARSRHVILSRTNMLSDS